MMRKRNAAPVPVQSCEKGAFCSGCAARQESIFRDLSPARESEIGQPWRTRTYAAGATVFREGDPPRGLYCVGAGFLKLSRSSPEGRAVVLGVCKAGDILGARPQLLGKPHDLTAEATGEARLCLISPNDFMNAISRHGDVSLRLTQKLSIELGDAYRQIFGAAFKPAVERLAEVLLALCPSHGQPVSEGIELNTNMCQNELADLAGMSRRNLNRALSALRGKGLIECHRRSIVVHDLAALRNFQGS